MISYDEAFEGVSARASYVRARAGQARHASPPNPPRGARTGLASLAASLRSERDPPTPQRGAMVFKRK